jgi:hypothetical protein
LGCSRHFRATDDVCPFCGRASEESVAKAPVVAKLEGRPLTRAAILFATAATATSVVGCGKDQDKPPVVVQPYGVPMPPPDAEPPPEVTKPDASTPVVVQPYGVPVPPPDAGPKVKPNPPPTAAPAYGVPPPTKH